MGCLAGVRLNKQRIKKVLQLKLVLEAKRENLDQVLALVDEQLEAADCPMKTQTQIDISVEEIFVNIANYAYGDAVGMAEVTVEIDPAERAAVMTFLDRGMHYDPLAKKDPDITLSAAERPIGGLGIFMVKKFMDDVAYEYKDGCNILTLRKKL